MISIIFAACMAATCHVVRLPFEGNEFQCMAFGQLRVVEYLRDYPGMTAPRGYRCEGGVRS